MTKPKSKVITVHVTGPLAPYAQQFRWACHQGERVDSLETSASAWFVDRLMNVGQGYSSDRTYAGQEALHGRAARGLSMVGGWPRLPGGEGGVCFGWGSATRSR